MNQEKLTASAATLISRTPTVAAGAARYPSGDRLPVNGGYRSQWTRIRAGDRFGQVTR